MTTRAQRNRFCFPVRVLALGLMIGLTACGMFSGDAPKPGAINDPMGRFPVNDPNNRNLLEPRTSSTATASPAAGGSGVGVNKFLWRASLDTVSFMPLASADPFGGVIITDWYAAPTVPNERFKVTVYILDNRLRADALRVSVFRQMQDKSGWTDAALDADTPSKLENAILTRARQMRISSTER